MSPPRGRRLYGGAHVNKTLGGRYECPSSGCHAKFTSHTNLVEHVQEIHRSTVLGVQYQLQHVQAQHDKNHDIVSFKETLLVELDDLIKDLELFDESRQSILRLKENFKNFNQRQLQYTETILSKKIASEKEKYKVNLKICQDEVKKLQIELIDNKQKIVLLEKSYKKLNEEYEKLNEKYDKLRKENEALLKHNNNYFVEHYYESQQEIIVLQKRNLELWEEIEKLKESNELLSVICLIPVDE
ncbi:hypothetical protein F8M41_002006 [Gigaspora margarita]|uniref:C2H2-type domain-containing protein n=1 Tax=Gigaspora margarita TaxID=4874 RepID=A0A8H3XDI7_GIGMA|nr:hypothetical protein F8M41_002006 [Gigaspora margarita]